MELAGVPDTPTEVFSVVPSSEHGLEARLWQGHTLVWDEQQQPTVKIIPPCYKYSTTMYTTSHAQKSFSGDCPAPAEPNENLVFDTWDIIIGIILVSFSRCRYRTTRNRLLSLMHARPSIHPSMHALSLIHI